MLRKEAAVYVPGAFTDEAHRLDSHYELQRILRREPDAATSQQGFPVYAERFDDPPAAPVESSERQVEEMLRDMDKKVYLETATNFELARELHKVNLEHDPLPDTVPDLHFRRMQMEQPQKHPGLAIRGGNFASAVGYQPHSGYAPNRCTKLKVFRPKTGSTADSEESVNFFDRRWRFIRQNKVRPIDLAIRWDMSPEDPADEPRRAKHIDGSNGSQAPAVFSMVPTPKADGGAAATSRSADALFERPKTTPVTRKEHEAHGKCCPNRLCVACELKSLPAAKEPKPQYKMAFKAGAPNSRGSSGSSHSRSVKVPKQKEPYGKRSYSIKSLNAPFCLKKDNREDYPDHWRLASVYQHSYKPIHLRKKSLLQSVFQ